MGSSCFLSMVGSMIKPFLEKPLLLPHTLGIDLQGVGKASPENKLNHSEKKVNKYRLTYYTPFKYCIF